MVSVAEAFVTLRPDATKFGQETSRAVGDSMARISAGLVGAGRGLTAAVTAPIVGIGVAALASTTRLGNMADGLFDLRDATGLSTDSLQEWRRVARAAGTDSDAVANAALLFTRRLEELAEAGDSRVVRVMDQLGVSVMDAAGQMRSMDDVMPQLLSRLGGIENLTQRAAVGAQIFGRQWATVAPIVGLGADEIARLRTEAQATGEVMSVEALTAANDYRIAMDDLKAEIGLVFRGLASDLVPVMRDTFVPLVRDNLVPLMKNLSTFVAAVAERFAALPQPLQVTALALAAIAAAAGPVLLTLGLMIPAVTGLAGAFVGLGIAIGPIGWVALAAGAVLATVAIGSLSRAMRDLNSEAERSLRIGDQTHTQTQEYVFDLQRREQAIRDQIAALETSNETWIQTDRGAKPRVTVLGELRQELKGVTTELTGQEKHLKALNDQQQAAKSITDSLADAMKGFGAETRNTSRDLAGMAPRAAAAAFAVDILKARMIDAALAASIFGRYVRGSLADMAFATAQGMMGKLAADFHEMEDLIDRLMGTRFDRGGGGGLTGSLRGVADAARDAMKAFLELDSRGRAMHVAQQLWAKGYTTVEAAMRSVHSLAVQQIRDLQQQEEAINKIADALLGIRNEERAFGAGGGDFLGFITARREALALATSGALSSGTAAQNVHVEQHIQVSGGSMSDMNTLADVTVQAVTRGSLAAI